ncbi:sarcosine oxidase subunit delta [Phaeobacter sp. B1627]|uniref:sarcosine oxidase subunit delta n=1 Tax=Phaeobacter sp. B1627 TaxID=2583809 RepID=UPI00111BC01C|nr:sarcosine oxidase subunit delta [Phaeobacter sp. B1627]TNJ41806.1 sarcosine oxidase subunit delta [Phaeobacter sp. B1627]
MRITCPICGERDRREFTYRGAALGAPALEAGIEAWHAQVHLRLNPAGSLAELWHHEMGCGAWVQVTRNTATHEMLGSVLAEDADLAMPAPETEVEP